MPLSDMAIKKAVPTEKKQKMFDGGGLYLEVAPSGGKLWRLKYRFGGKEKLLALLYSYMEITSVKILTLRMKGKKTQSRS